MSKLTDVDVINQFLSILELPNSSSQPGRAAAEISTDISLGLTDNVMRHLGIFKKESASLINLLELQRIVKAVQTIITNCNKGNVEDGNSELTQLKELLKTLPNALSAYKHSLDSGVDVDVDANKIKKAREALQEVQKRIGEFDANLNKNDWCELLLAHVDQRIKQKPLAENHQRLLQLIDATKKNNDVLGIQDARELGNQMLRILSETTGDPALVKPLQEKLMLKIEQIASDRAQWTDLDKQIVRCLACSNEDMPVSISKKISDFRCNYDLTFPNLVEYHSNRSQYIEDQERRSIDVDIAQLQGQTINIVLCALAYPDVITAVEQYIRKLEATKPRTTLVFKDREALKAALEKCNEHGVDVHLTSVSHGSDQSLGYKDLPNELKKLVATWVDNPIDANNKAVLAKLNELGLNNGFFNEGMLKIIYNYHEHKTLGLILSTIRLYIEVLPVEEQALADVVNSNQCISRLRVLACVSAGEENDPSLQSMHRFNLPYKEERFGGRNINALYIIDDSHDKRSKVASIAEKITREGVVVKGEYGPVNPGTGGVLKFNSEFQKNSPLYTTGNALHATGGTARFIKIPSAGATRDYFASMTKALQLIDESKKSDGLSKEKVRAAKELAELLEHPPEKSPMKQKYISSVILELRSLTANSGPSPGHNS